jgi:hypothetical protein
MVNECTLFFFVKKEKKELLWFSLFFGFGCQKTEEKRGKEEDAFSTTKRRKRLMTAHFLFTQTHGTNIIIMVFTTVLSTVRVVASSVSRHSLSFSILPRFSLSLSLHARMRAVLASRLFTPLFYPFLKKCIITHRRNNNHNNSEPKLSLARPHRRRALSP